MKRFQSKPANSPSVKAGQTPIDPSVSTLRILATSDVHAHILAWDYHSHRPHQGRGLARVASLIETARAEVANSILLDNGDFLHGSSLGDHATFAKSPTASHPMIRAMNLLGYDAANLGNHEFSHGLEFLAQSLIHANFPVLSSNLRLPLFTFFHSHILLTRQIRTQDGQAHDLKVGVLGVLPAQTLIWEHLHLSGRAEIDPMITALQRGEAELRASGADLVIALCHTGLGNAKEIDTAENIGQKLAALPGVDALIFGHTHEVFPLPNDEGPSNLEGKPAVMPGFNGSHLGIIDLTLQRGLQGWTVIAHHAEARPIASRNPVTGEILPNVPDHPIIAQTAEPEHSALHLRMDRKIGTCPVPLNTYFALLSDCAALDLVAEAQRDYVRTCLGHALDLPLLSAVAPFKAGGRGGPENFTAIPKGPILARHIDDLYVHPNSVEVLRLTGADVAEWIERAVSLFHQVPQGAQDAPLIDPTFPSFNFDIPYGVTFRIDLSSPARFDAFGQIANPHSTRVRDLKHDGALVPPTTEFLLATNSYRVAGGAGFAGARAENAIALPPIASRDAVQHYIERRRKVTPTRRAAWGFRPMKGTSVAFDSAPEAAFHLASHPDLALTPLGQCAEGFQRFRLHL